MNYPKRVIIDTNVLIVANEKSSHASSKWVKNAVDFLEHARKKAVLVLDTSWEIYEQYRKYCSHKGQPGVGDYFFLHLHRRQADHKYVQLVDIHPDGAGSYLEIPPVLSEFDPSDKMFIAVAISDQCRAVIVNCVDSDWNEAKVELESSGITVRELCPDE